MFLNYLLISYELFELSLFRSESCLTLPVKILIGSIIATIIIGAIVGTVVYFTVIGTNYYLLIPFFFLGYIEIMILILFFIFSCSS